MLIKMNVNQVVIGESQPRLAVKDLIQKSHLRKGFNGITKLACHNYAKGATSLDEALSLLEMKLLFEFKDTVRNRKRVASCKIILEEYSDFLENYGLTCLLCNTKFKHEFDSLNRLSCDGVGLYQNQFGKYAGVIFVEDEFNYTSLKAPWERYIISKRMGVRPEDVDLFLFRLNDCSHEKLHVKSMDLDTLIERTSKVFSSVRNELDNLKSA